MSIKIKVQRDYLLTEATVETSDLNALSELLKSAKATGKIVAIYSQGGTVGVSIEQKSLIHESISEEVRKMVGVQDRRL